MAKLAIAGGRPELKVRWPKWPVRDGHEERALLRVLRSGLWYRGENVRKFEEGFARFQRAGYGVTCNSGTAALEISLAVLGVGRGDEVIVPAYTFVATAGSVLRVGAKVVFADILPGNLCIDPADVARKMGPRTRAIIPVHFAGHIADMDRLKKLARRKGVHIIEDACHAWGSRWKGKGAGALGDCGAFSFQVSKNITSGDGGIILTDDETLADGLRNFTNVGRKKGGAWYEHYTPSTNARMTEFQAAILREQLKRLGRQTMKRQANARILDRGLAAIPGIRTVVTDPRHTRRAYHMYCFRLDLEALGTTRARFLSALSAEGVPCTAGYGIPLYANPLFTGKKGGAGIPSRGAPCPEVERVVQDCCWIMHQNLLAPASAMRGIVRAVAKVVEHSGELGRL